MDLTVQGGLVQTFSRGRAAAIREQARNGVSSRKAAMKQTADNIVPLGRARRTRELLCLSDALARARRDRKQLPTSGRGALRFRGRAHYLQDDGEDRRGLRVGVIAWLTAAMTACVLAGGALLLALTPG